MCGITGYTDPERFGQVPLAGMTASLNHRGPDDEGTFIDGSIAFGHRRLAVIDMEGGAQPRSDGESGDVLVFNGEIYGYRELAEALRRDGVPLRDHSDTEVLFWLIRRHGVEGALERINGMFAFAFRDGTSGCIWLVRDRFGEKPLYYGIKDGNLIFASEIRAILLHPAFENCGSDMEAVDQFLTYEYLPGELTGFDTIRKLPPGHRLVFRRGEAEIAPYWRPEIGQRADAGNEEVVLETLESMLDASVRSRLIADVPVGVFLSGGVDSSLVAAFAARHAPGVTAFTVRMPDRTYDETPYAVKVAERYGMRHEIIDFEPAELCETFDSVTSHLDELLADSSLIPTSIICRAAQRKVTVALGGDGADELFAGYPNFKARRLSRLMAALPEGLGRGLRGVLNLLPDSDRYIGPGFVLRQLSQGFGKQVERQSALWMAPFSARERAALWTAEAAPGGDVFAPLAEAARQAPQDPVDRLLYLFTVTYLAEDILVKVDRSSMQHSLEVRSPFLDRGFAEYALSLPKVHKMRGFETKHLLKKLAARHLPREAVYRSKQGFALPLAGMLRESLYDMVSNVLLDRGNSATSWFERKAIERYLNEHHRGKRDHRKKIWTLYVLFKVMSRHLGPS
jgi:asparagine synthase (glutamine-hydrolysing)